MEYNLNETGFYLDIEKEEHPLDFVKIFGNEKPVHLEIGCGKGEFLESIAEQKSDINFIGIELKPRRVYTISKKLDLDVHKNVKLVQLYVDKKINEYIKPGSIEVIYIQHPDPWPKRRHHKRRLFQHDFIDSLNMILPVGGEVRIATDHPEYALWIQKHFYDRKDFESLFAEGYSYEITENHIETYYEKRWRGFGFKPVFMNYKKVRNL